MGALAVQNFLSAAVGIAVAVALIRGFARKGAKTVGNFWVDLVRGTIYVLLPIAFLAAIVFIAQGEGALQTLAGPAGIHDALNGVKQVIPRGPVASQETIKQLRPAVELSHLRAPSLRAVSWCGPLAAGRFVSLADRVGQFGHGEHGQAIG